MGTAGPASPFGRISEEALRRATGRGADEWFAAMDAAGAAGMAHRDIVAHLERHHPECGSAWWRQSIAVAYERARGLRQVGQTAGAGWQVGIQRTLAAPAEAVWLALIGRPELWLGPGAPAPAEGGRYRAGRVGDIAGADGDIRVVAPGRRLRLTWRPDGWEAPAALQLTLTARRPDATTLAVHLEKLPDAGARERMRDHWRDVLRRVAGAVA